MIVISLVALMALVTLIVPLLLALRSGIDTWEDVQRGQSKWRSPK